MIVNPTYSPLHLPRVGKQSAILPASKITRLRHLLSFPVASSAVPLHTMTSLPRLAFASYLVKKGSARASSADFSRADYAGTL